MRVAIGVVAALVLAGSASAASTQKPVLKLRAETVQGLHFRANERVRLTFNGSKIFKRTVVRANADGSFTVRLPVATGACGGISISAVGEDGAHALAGMGFTNGCAPYQGGTKIPLRVPAPTA